MSSQIRNMKQEEMRNIPLNTQQHKYQTQNNNQQLNNNHNHNHNHNYRYQQHLNNTQSITDNIGILYNYNETSDLTNGEKSEEIKTKLQYHNLRIYSQDRKWYLDTKDTFTKLIINLDTNQSITQKEHIQVNKSFQNVIGIYSPIMVIPNIFSYLDKSQPQYIHININDTTLSHSTNTKKNQILTLQEHNEKTTNYLTYKCMETEILSIENNISNKIDITSGLAISILNQYQQPLWDSIQDKIKIKTITYNCDTQLIDIYFTNYLFPNIWQSGNTIIIKNYKFRETDLDYEECHIWNSFINREEGHNIKIVCNEKNKQGKDKCCKISIEVPITFNQNNGEIEPDTWFSNLLLKTNIDTYPNVNQENSGICLNLDLQTVIQLQIITKDKIKNSIDFTNI